MSRFTVFETADPDDAVDRLVRLFGSQRTSINSSALMPGRTSLSVANIASSFLCRLTSSHQLLFSREEPKGLIGLTVVLSGHMGVTSHHQEAEFRSPATLGFVLAQDEPFKAALGNYDGLTFGIPRATLHASMQALTGIAPAVPLRFRSSVEADHGGRMLQHTLDMIARQLAGPESPLAHPTLAARLEEFIINALLHSQPHNYLAALTAERPAAVPRQVRRAEEYIHANAGEIIKLSQIAEAAGCSVRALQLAFRTFRDTTPMSLLRRTRLERAHAELLQSDPGATTVTEIAVKYGFFNVGRFAQDYRSAFGQSPSETLRQPAPLRMK